VGSLLTPPDDVEVLKNFYVKVRPWGAWRPIHQLVVAERLGLTANRDFTRDMANVTVGIAWQTALTATGVYIVLQNWTAVACTAIVIGATSLFLKFNWYDKLKDDPDYAPAAPLA
jgi:hypothetical protein